MDYVVVCEHCGGEVLTASRVSDAEAFAMREHLQRCESIPYERVRRVLPGGLGSFAELLRHFRVTLADGPRI